MLFKHVITFLWILNLHCVLKSPITRMHLKWTKLHTKIPITVNEIALTLIWPSTLPIAKHV